MEKINMILTLLLLISMGLISQEKFLILTKQIAEKSLKLKVLEAKRQKKLSYLIRLEKNRL